MMTDSDRFAFTARRYHGFATSGNAYDATETDEAIKTGDTLLILPERVVGVANTWPFAVTSHFGHLHAIKPKPDDTLGDFARSLKVGEADIASAVTMAVALGFEIDPALAIFFPSV